MKKIDSRLSTEAEDSLFPRNAIGRLRDMKPSGFLPDIKRNRFVTNWAVVYLADLEGVVNARPPGAFGRHHKIAGFAIMALLVTSVILMATPRLESSPSASIRLKEVNAARDSAAPPTALPSHSAVARLTERDVCTEEFLKAQVGQVIVRPPEAPIAKGYSLGSVEFMGGTLFANYTCEAGSDRFSAQWVRAGEKWQLKKISRPPERRPGDL
jgi:hypothetical protein